MWAATLSMSPLADDRNASLYCNDEGKINGLPSNRRLGGDIIAGTFFICGSDGGEYDCSLTDEQIAHYKGRFAAPGICHAGLCGKISVQHRGISGYVDGRAGRGRPGFL